MSKKIGIIGGVGPQATSYLYDQIIASAIKDHGAKNNDDFPNILIHSLPIPDFISDESGKTKALDMIQVAVSDFKKSGCTAYAIASNTVHILEPQINTSLEFLHMPKLVVQQTKQNNFKSLSLLGTPTLLMSKLYNQIGDSLGINILTPDPQCFNLLESIIRTVISGNTVSDIDKNRYIDLINSMLASTDALILGCTELPLFMNYEALGKRILNSEKILAKGITDYFYAK